VTVPDDDLQHRPLVLDGHNDLPWALRQGTGGDVSAFRRPEAEPAGVGHPLTTLARVRRGGVGAQFWSVFVPGTLPADQAVTQTLEQVDTVHRLVAANPDDLVLATTAAQVEEAWAGGRIASLLGAEGGHSIGSSLGALRMLHRLGVRYLTLTHNENTPWAGSATDTAVPGGLTAFGAEVVRELNRLGMLVDLSHVSVDTMHAALDVSEAPVVFSHSSARAVTDVVRNVPDDVLGRMAAAGGVCLVTFVPDFVNDEVARWRAEAQAAAVTDGVEESDEAAFLPWEEAYRRAHPRPAATIDDVVRHVEHVREVAGVEHVGLGGDYDGTQDMPVGLEDVSAYPRLLQALAGRGWSTSDLARLAHGNALRLLRDVEAVADSLASRPPSLATIGELDGIPG
jgi:membrane dipeptidase